ncbi:MAG: PLP-dependent aspartate aminotransferase family protein [Termitinemataceae bacterium]|nr:MAG: PLP-dependent aspartate aminotransferase family protein [Termitinemataceae bacterium]
MTQETLLVHGAHSFEPHTGALSTPIYQSATFRHPSLGQSTGFDYSRCGNPTVAELEANIACAEHGKGGLAFASGMGAISALIKLFHNGDHIIVSQDLYGGTYRLFNEYYASYGMEFSWVDTSDFAQIEAAIKASTKCLFVETPSNPMMTVADIERCAALIHKKGGILVVDNTFLTPYFQNPLDLGADIVVHSGTKYIAGHHDTLCGLLAYKDLDKFDAPLRAAQMSEGATLGPFDAWLALRGMKTLALRMEKSSQNAAAIADMLRCHPAVEKVFYAGFSDHAGYAVSKKQACGFGSMISFYLKNAARLPEVLKKVKLIMFAESLGGVESLITYPLVQTHAAIPQDMRERAGINDKLLRLAVGIESTEDLIADLKQALE